MMRARRGFTVLEVIVVLALLLFLLVIVYRLWSTAARYSRTLEDRTERLERLHHAMVRLSREVQLARRLLFPLPGAAAQDGLCVISGTSEPLLFRLERPGPDQAGTLTVRNLRTGEVDVVSTGIMRFTCRVPGVPGGRDPDLVHLLLESGEGRSFGLFSSARLRTQDARCPLER